MQVTENKGARHILIAKISAFARIRPLLPDLCFGGSGRTRTVLGRQFLTTHQRPLTAVLNTANQKLAFLLSPRSSTTSKFLIDNFKRLPPTFRSHSFTTFRQDAISSGAPPVAASAKGGRFPIANQHASQKLEFCLTALSSATSKFLIDNFHRDFAFLERFFQAFRRTAFLDCGLPAVAGGSAPLCRNAKLDSGRCLVLLSRSAATANPRCI